jgi:hypothetical protein
MTAKKCTTLVLAGLAVAASGCGGSGSITDSTSCHAWLTARSGEQTRYASEAISNLKEMQPVIYTTDSTRFAGEISRACLLPRSTTTTVQQVAIQLVQSAAPPELGSLY